jgi:hypothetical protein
VFKGSSNQSQQVQLTLCTAWFKHDTQAAEGCTLMRFSSSCPCAVPTSCTPRSAMLRQASASASVPISSTMTTSGLWAGSQRIPQRLAQATFVMCQCMGMAFISCTLGQVMLHALQSRQQPSHVVLHSLHHHPVLLRRVRHLRTMFMVGAVPVA